MAFPIGPVLAVLGVSGAAWWYWTHWRTLLHQAKSYALTVSVTDPNGRGLEQVTSELALMLGTLDGKSPLGPAVTVLAAPTPRNQDEVRLLLAGKPAVFIAMVQANRDVKAGLLLEALGAKVHLDHVQELPVAPLVPGGAGSADSDYEWELSDPSSKRLPADIANMADKVGQYLGFNVREFYTTNPTAPGPGVRWKGRFGGATKPVTAAQVQNAFAQAQLQVTGWNAVPARAPVARTVSGWARG